VCLQERRALHSDSFNIASVLSPTASSAMPDLLSDRPPSPVAEFGMPVDIGGAPLTLQGLPYPLPAPLRAAVPGWSACCGDSQQLCSSRGLCIVVVSGSPIFTSIATAGEPDLRSYTPLKAEDHQRCGMAFTMKVRLQPHRSCGVQLRHFEGPSALMVPRSIAQSLPPGRDDVRCCGTMHICGCCRGTATAGARGTRRRGSCGARRGSPTASRRRGRSPTWTATTG
jgi:hypothetical protein